MWVLTDTVPAALVNLANVCSAGLEEGQLVAHMVNGETLVLVDLPARQVGARFEKLRDELAFHHAGGLIDLADPRPAPPLVEDLERERASHMRHED